MQAGKNKMRFTFDVPILWREWGRIARENGGMGGQLANATDGIIQTKRNRDTEHELEVEADEDMYEYEDEDLECTAPVPGI